MDVQMPVHYETLIVLLRPVQCRQVTKMKSFYKRLEVIIKDLNLSGKAQLEASLKVTEKLKNKLY